jgi:EpsI family protein
MAQLRLACVALALVLPLGALQLAKARSQREARAVERPALPASLGEWVVLRETELDTKVSDMLAPEWYAMRLYGAQDRPPIWLYTAFYRGVGTVGAHDPLVCYPAQGWTIAQRHEVAVGIDGGGSFPAWFMRTELAGEEELVLYWFQPVRRWPSPALGEYFMRAVDRLRGTPEYAFVRLSLRSSPSRGDGSDAGVVSLSEFASALAPWARDVVSAGSE